MDHTLNETVAGRLKAGEAALWTGQPNALRTAKPAGLAAGAAVLVLLAWIGRRGTAEFVTWPVLSLAGFAVLAAVIALRAYRRGSRTVYVLTDRRLVRFRFGWRTSETSFPVAEVRGFRVRPHSDGTADFVFENGSVFSAVQDPAILEAMLASRAARQEGAPKSARLPVPPRTARSIAGVVACLVSPLLDPFGYLLTLVGLILFWRRTGLTLRARLALTPLALLPRIIPALVEIVAAPGELSFVLEPDAPATLSSAWAGYVLVWALSAAVVLARTERVRALFKTARSTPEVRRGRLRFLAPIVAVGLIAFATVAILGLGNDFEWIEAVDTRSLQLKHTFRGTVATFSADAVDSIHGTEQDGLEHHIQVRLRDGKTYGMSTGSRWAYGELKKLAATVDLPAGRMRLESGGLLPWTNGQSGFTLKHFAGTYEAPEGGGILELGLATGRLTGTETIVGSGGERVTRALRAIKVTEYGEIEYRTDTLTVASGYFSMHLGISRGVLDKDALQIGATRYQKRRASGPLVPFEQNEKWGYKDESGRVAIAARFQIANEFSKEGIAAIVDEKGWAYIDARGRLLLRPFVVDNGPDYFSDGLARFIVNGRFGFFDQTGTVVIAPQYAFAAPFSEERAAVCEGCKEVSEGEHRSFRGGRWGYIDRRGELAIPYQFEEAGKFEQGRAKVRAVGRWRCIDRLGKTEACPGARR